MFSNLRGKVVLDVGCGTGRWLEKFVAHGCALGIGIDSSIAMLRVAARKNAIREHLAHATCEHLPLPNGVFDIVVCSFALGHIENVDRLAKELSRVSKIGAHVLVTDLHPDSYTRGWRVGFRDGTTSLQIQAQPHPAEQIIHAFAANGFQCLKHLPLFLEDPERPLFTKAGKLEFFDDACRLPAVLVCHFRRTPVGIEDRFSEAVHGGSTPAPIEEPAS